MNDFLTVSSDWIKHTPSYKHSAMMDAILKRLEQEHNITFFHYARRLQNGNYFELTTNRAWGFCYVQKYLQSDTFISLKHLNKNVWVWGDDVSDKKELAMHEERTQNYKIPKGISFILDGSDTFSYSSNKISEKNIIENISHIRNKELIEFEKSFLIRIQPIINEFLSEKINVKKIETPIKSLTQTEIIILNFLSKGFRTCEISKILNNTEGTIKNKIESIKEKTNSRTREQAVAYALKKGYF